MILEAPEPRVVRPAPMPWPPEVELILSAMDAAPAPAQDTRRTRRMSYRVRADLKLFSDARDAAPWTLYTRDVDPRGLGFITPHRLPLGYGGWVEVPMPNGRSTRVACTLYRCRQAVPGWYEGALYFNREQWGFSSD